METGLSRLTTDEKLKEAFSPFGQIVDGNTPTHPTPHNLKFYVFLVVMSTSTHSLLALCLQPQL